LLHFRSKLYILFLASHHKNKSYYFQLWLGYLYNRCKKCNLKTSILVIMNKMGSFASVKGIIKGCYNWHELGVLRWDCTANVLKYIILRFHCTYAMVYLTALQHNLLIKLYSMCYLRQSFIYYFCYLKSYWCKIWCVFSAILITPEQL
jgi:hypothetical protein